MVGIVDEDGVVDKGGMVYIVGVVEGMVGTVRVVEKVNDVGIGLK